MESWEHEQFNSYYEPYRFRGSSHRTRYETVPDSKRLGARKGDIIKFGSGFYERPFGDWKDWFLTSRADRKIFWNRRKSIPLYSIHQFAVVANHYRWIKYKSKTFMDYGAIIMMVTGKKPCHFRKYYIDKPYRKISAFPHIHKDRNIYVKMKKPFKVIDKTWFLFDFNLSEFITKLLSVGGESEESRDMFLKKVKQILEANI